MASTELQRIVDSLGERLQRSVAVDDRKMRLQAYSPHFGPVDPVRLGSILTRQAPEASIRWITDVGVPKATEPLSVPRNDELEMLARFCVPLIYQNIKLGYLWLIEGDEPLTDAEVAETKVAAEAVSVVMYRERLVSELERGKERELLRDLLSEDATLRTTAAQALLDDEIIASGPVTVLVLRICSKDALSGHARDAIDIALANARRQLPLRHAIHLVRPDHGLLVVVTSEQVIVTKPELAERILQDFAKHCDVTGTRPVVGIGDQHATCVDALASYKQAQQAAHVAEILPSMGQVVPWRQLGIYRTLAQLPPDELAADALHPGLLRLLNDVGDTVLLQTLECFLDLAGDAKATAEALQIHRTSLYYRLGRIEELASVNLRDGGDRLSLHLGLKIARLAGLRTDT